MNKLDLIIEFKKESNYHQVRVEIDNKNVIEWFIWIDPPMFFEQDTLSKNGKLIIWICPCGVQWCDNKIIQVDIKQDTVQWTMSWNEKYKFNKEGYLDYINIKKNDYSRENESSRIERLTNDIFKGTQLEWKRYWKIRRFKKTDKFDFNRSSTRLDNPDGESQVSLSYNNNYQQEILSFPWYKDNEERTLKEARRFKKNNTLTIIE